MGLEVVGGILYKVCMFRMAYIRTISSRFEPNELFGDRTDVYAVNLQINAQEVAVL